jgi:cysteine desulfurase
MSAPIYLDNHATTRCDPRVVEAMLPYFSESYGNAASKTHTFGWTAEAAVDLGREQVAEAIGGQRSEITFCSGATEANNLALAGAARAYAARGRHLVVAATEHPSVLDCARALVKEGFELTELDVGDDGLVEPQRLRDVLREDTTVVSIMLANNEIGVVQPIAELAAVVHERSEQCWFHCDGAQALGKMPVDVAALGVDLFTLSAHKLYGPKGVGALWKRRRPRVVLEPLLHGGGHEGGLRPGTLPVPLVVGFGRACALAREELETECERVRGLRDRLLAGLRERVGGIVVNGSLEHRVPGNLNISFEGVQGDALVMAARGVAVSTGSACAAASAKPSHVLAAIADAERARSAVRFGVGRFNGSEDIERAIDIVAEGVETLRARPHTD